MKKQLLLASMALFCVTGMAQSSEAGYPVGNWQNCEEDGRYCVDICIDREMDKEYMTYCGTITIDDQQTNKHVCEGSLIYIGRDVDNNGMSTDVYNFEIVNGENKRGSIGIRKMLNNKPDQGNRTKVQIVSVTGDFANHPAFKLEVYSVGAGNGAAFDPTPWVVNDKELMEALKEGVANGYSLKGFGNVRQYINAHAKLIPGQPKYAKCKAANAINIRLTPDARSQKLGELPPGTTLYVADEFNGWCKVHMFGKQYGWVSLNVINLTNTPSNNTILSSQQSLSFTGPAIVDGNLAFMGISTGEQATTMKRKLVEMGFKDTSTRNEMSVEGLLNGVKKFIVIQQSKDGRTGSINVYDRNGYTLTKAKACFNTVLQELISIYGKGTYSANEDYYKVYEINVGGGKVLLDMHDADELSGDSGYYEVSVVIR